MLRDLSIEEYEELFTYYCCRQWGSSIQDYYEARKIAVGLQDRDIVKYKLMKPHEEQPKNTFNAFKQYLQATGHLVAEPTK